MAEEARYSQAVLEVLRQEGAPALRYAQAVVEVLRANTEVAPEPEPSQGPILLVIAS